MPYATDRDRAPTTLELEGTPWPLAPLNLFLKSVYKPGAIDLIWTNPAELAGNGTFQVLGVHIYRSFDSEFGPFDRITDLPVGATTWRDQTDNVLVLEEPVSDDMWIFRGENEGNQEIASDQHSLTSTGQRYLFRTRHHPIVQAGSQALPEYNPNNVVVLIDGVRARVLRVLPETGDVEIDPRVFAEVGTQKRDVSLVPPVGSDVRVSYRYNRRLLRTDLGQRIFYRVVTVGVSIEKPLHLAQPQDVVETPLERAAATSNREIEKLDYIWNEAVRRNRWILDQGGERVKVFLHKQVGQPCLCAGDRFAATQGQDGLSDCQHCIGTGILGGFEGPFDIIIAPDDGERRISQKDTGRTVEHTYEVFTGPSPLLSQRDLLVKINGERWSVGAVRMPTNRGMILQQHFMIGLLDEKDIRYSVPVDDPQGLIARPQMPPFNDSAEVSEKPNIPDDRELRGRSKVWENITW